MSDRGRVIFSPCVVTPLISVPRVRLAGIGLITAPCFISVNHVLIQAIISAGLTMSFILDHLNIPYTTYLGIYNSSSFYYTIHITVLTCTNQHTLIYLNTCTLTLYKLPKCMCIYYSAYHLSKNIYALIKACTHFFPFSNYIFYDSIKK